jgi:hypothetical protein
MFGEIIKRAGKILLKLGGSKYITIILLNKDLQREAAGPLILSANHQSNTKPVSG